MYITPFLQYLSTELRCSPHTILSYEKDLLDFQNFINATEENLTLTEVELIHLRNFIIHLSENGKSASTINRKLAALKRFYKYCVKTGAIEHSFAAQLKNLKKPKQVHLPYSEEEMNKLPEQDLDNSDDFSAIQKTLIIELLYQTGMRRAELIELTNDSLHVDNLTLKVVGKRNKERLIPIAKELRNALIEFQQIKKENGIESPHLLCLKNGKKLYPKFVYNVVNSYLSHSTLKEKKSPHMLRHTFATHILNNGADINSVKELLGHSSLASTQVYTHQDIETLKEIFRKTHPREIKS